MKFIFQTTGDLVKLFMLTNSITEKDEIERPDKSELFQLQKSLLISPGSTEIFPIFSTKIS